jgi:YidC/Oxa1 family membrane protein insertase
MQQSGPGPGEFRNILIAFGLSALIFLGFELFYNAPMRERLARERAQVEATQTADGSTASGEAAPSAPPGPVEREVLLNASAEARVNIDTASVDGSISLRGARFDDLNLRNYRVTIEDGSPEVSLLAPIASEYGHDAYFGWEAQVGESAQSIVDTFSEWQASDGATLAPGQPITLTLTTENGLQIERTIAIDEHYMFTITDVVRNPGDAAISARPFGAVRRHGMPQDYRHNGVVHQGMIGVFGPEDNYHPTAGSYQNADKFVRRRERGQVEPNERLLQDEGEGGWLGITDHYWLTAIVPDQSERVSAWFDAQRTDGETDYRAGYRGQWREIPAGGEITYTQRLFAGAKEYELLRDYQRDLEIPRFDDAIDWGNFWFLTRPFFQWLLHPLGQLFASWGIAFNFGLAIIASTIVVKLLLFPLVYQSFKSMAKMRALAPKMKEVQERYAADKQRQQQEILKLYQTEKINPVSGCVPILLQIPVFFALYKVLNVTIEMRHAPFVGWVNDLSAADPATIFNLFGLLPYDPASVPLIGAFLAVGVWHVLYGVSMAALQGLSPPPTDATQASIMRILPIIFVFMFATFPVGLVIYWTWSNVLSILQQYVIMRRQGVETEFDKFVAKRLKRSEAPAE